MCDALKSIKKIKKEIQRTTTVEELKTLRIKYLGKKGYLASKMQKLFSLSLDKKKIYGSIINKFKSDLNIELDLHKKILDMIAVSSLNKKEKNFDVSLISRKNDIGTIHPITYVISSIENFFLKLGFSVITGFEIDDDYHNFDLLNIPKYHPARADHDTFWFDANRLLRTQTSNMQIRTMKNETPPIKIIVPGKVYRNDYDATHTPMFHQVEGLIVDHDVNFFHLKWIIEMFLKFFFNKTVKIRFKSSYFPFTVLSAEVDILGNNKKWLEVLGCGMIHPKVLSNANINPKMYSGCAFGIGVERITMLRYGISDIRVFYENNLKFLTQFK
ncbi:phenylalanyl-tRNA synthetase alpha chain [Buchnera aphidicola str. Bp (Baizongia pistaciae)]|uniref:Phenylalanine--tRNA ligase alpha subunit n=1 Tax=Buchnera aphidicola subsp. Baizongia pistaciae (strain Bp) TaxID=224915 RepID=SYFA_BUCBP|nr:phenylalanine--tRNA ligase subunit alpha [Buchnera aphidicola]P59504.1 RecName: Full=Phenylalanine--tRNA ligase alpha subunit; AltName: Full=Phenylalanyl-tRNA synthetase alpha subunit; Short=PheRS [Buchnera aphidicola str. Bp (Baizongia pistaciae)]AAO26857.1 phenylalanyl-tRNA synthetase alpha chain [Buchnera aphidicola str. Bp (Baizongia pistaciae)]